MNSRYHADGDNPPFIQLDFNPRFQAQGLDSESPVISIGNKTQIN